MLKSIRWWHETILFYYSISLNVIDERKLSENMPTGYSLFAVCGVYKYMHVYINIIYISINRAEIGQ